MKFFLLISLFANFCLFNSYKILVINPKFGYSHVQFVGRIAELLAEDGNEVVQLVVEMDPKIKSNGTEKVKNVIYQSSENVTKRLEKSGKHVNVWDTKFGSMEQLEALMDIIESCRDVGTQMIYDKELSKRIKEEKFDMAISEIFNIFSFGLFKEWEIETTIAISAIPLVETYRWFYGMDYPPSYVPGINMNFKDRMTYSERASNLINYVIMRLVFELDKTYDYTSLMKIANPEKNINVEWECGEVSFLFLNTHPYLDFPKTLPPKIQEIGGIAIPESKPLSKEWDDILNKREKNVLLSFGTVVETKNMPLNIRENIMKSFSHFKNVTFIWKVDKDDIDLDKDHGNIIFTSWVPQSDLLADDRLDLFITHCGLNSFMEISYLGKVALAIPFLADQFRNSKLLEKSGAGKAIIKDILEDSNKFTEILDDMLENQNYKMKANRVKAMIKSRPLSPKEVFLKHVKIAKEFKKLPELDLASRDLSFMEYYNLDIILPFIILLILIFYSILKVTKIVLECLLFSRKEKMD
uniref:glucuronosyltransferase n=1 Tax=Parastrongyloides trichosuri TaxID=131310 RepID=A0A0N4ZYQ2_PARTI